MLTVPILPTPLPKVVHRTPIFAPDSLFYMMEQHHSALLSGESSRDDDFIPESAQFLRHFRVEEFDSPQNGA